MHHTVWLLVMSMSRHGRSSLLIIVWKIVLPVPSISNSSCMRRPVRDVRTIPHQSPPVDIIVAHEYYWSRPSHCPARGKTIQQMVQYCHRRLSDWHGTVTSTTSRQPLKMLIPTFSRASRVTHSWGRVSWSPGGWCRTSGWPVSPAPSPRRRSSWAEGWPVERGSVFVTWNCVEM